MARWRELHDALARERYPHLVSFAALLTADDEPARELVDGALTAELSRARRRDRPSTVEEAVRARIVREFVRRGDTIAPAVEAGAIRPEQSVPAPSPETPPEPHSSVFAPPGHDGVVPPDSVPEEAPVDERRERAEPVPLAVALATLAPVERAAVVLHHVERLTPAQVARTLGEDASKVRDRLASADAELARATGLTVRPAAYAEDAEHLQVSVMVSPAGRA